MNKISKKLHDLEKNVLDDRPKTKTILYIEDPTEREIHKNIKNTLLYIQLEKALFQGETRLHLKSSQNPKRHMRSSRSRF